MLLLALSLLGLSAPPEGTADPFEASLGEMTFSQGSFFGFGQIGDYLSLTSDSLPSRTQLHFFVLGYGLAYPNAPAGGTGYTSFVGINPAVGLKLPARWGFWEFDAGLGTAEEYYPGTLPVSEFGVYLQGEVNIDQGLGGGDLDLFANYLGFAEYLFTQATYLYPVGPQSSHDWHFFAGPEAMFQGNSYYGAIQGGVAFATEWSPIHSILLLETGVIQQSESGTGGVFGPDGNAGWYQGVSWIFRY